MKLGKAGEDRTFDSIAAIGQVPAFCMHVDPTTMLSSYLISMSVPYERRSSTTSQSMRGCCSTSVCCQVLIVHSDDDAAASGHLHEKHLHEIVDGSTMRRHSSRMSKVSLPSRKKNIKHY